MSVLDQQCRANANLVFADIGSGGGGGGGGSGNLASTFTSTLTVSSIVGTGGAIQIPGSLAVNTNLITNGAFASTMTVSSISGWGSELAVTGAGLFVDTTAGILFPTNGSVDFQDNLGALVGVSSINNVAYPPPASLAVQTAPLANGGTTVLPQNSAGGPIGVTGLFATTAGKLYTAYLKLETETLAPAGVPAGSDHYSFIDPTAGVALTRMYSEISSISTLNPRGQLVTCSWVANGPTASITAYNNIGTTQSTILTFDTTFGCRVVQMN